MEQFYKGGGTSKITKLREHAERTSHGGKRKVGESTLSIRTKKVCASKSKKKGKLISKLKSNKSETNMLEIQSGKFMTSKNVNTDFCLPEFSATQIMTWKCHVD